MLIFIAIKSYAKRKQRYIAIATSMLLHFTLAALKDKSVKGCKEKFRRGRKAI